MHRTSLGRVRTVAAAAAALVAGLGLAAPAAASAPTPTYQRYVALGDSYTSSTGFSLTSPPTTEFVPVGCFQSSSDYPHQVARQLHVAQFVDASCGNATLRDFTAVQHTVLGDNAAQFDHLTEQTDLVTIGIGGNDVGLVPAAEGCIVDSLTGVSCRRANTVDGVDQVEAKISATEQSVVDAIEGVRTRAPRARIAVVNYLDAVPDNGRACFPYFPMSQENVSWFTGIFKAMNAMLASAARAGGAELIDTYTPTIGHDVCQARTVRFVEFLGLSLNPIGSLAAPLHPNLAGANAQSAAVYAQVSGPHPGA